MAQGKPASGATAGTPGTSAALAPDLRGGDAWAWERRLTVTCRDYPAGAEILLRVNDEPVLAERGGTSFVAAVPLRPGGHRIVAVLTHREGWEEVSDAVIHTVRLFPRPTGGIHVAIEGDADLLAGSGSAAIKVDGSPIVHWPAPSSPPYRSCSSSRSSGGISAAASPSRG